MCVEEQGQGDRDRGDKKIKLLVFVVDINENS